VSGEADAALMDSKANNTMLVDEVGNMKGLLENTEGRRGFRRLSRNMVTRTEVWWHYCCAEETCGGAGRG
jgi:hypothetical protein